VKFSLKAIERIFPIELRNFKLWKMPELLNFIGFQKCDIFLNFDKTDLKRFSKIFFLFPNGNAGR